MKTPNTEYLSKSSVGSPLAFKKSPGKYGYAEAKNNDSPFLEKSTASTSKKQWTSSDYNNLKRIPDQFSNMRQTFDARTNARLAEKFAKYDFGDQDPGKQKADNILRSTFNGKFSSPSNRDLTNSTYDRGYKRQNQIDYQKYDRTVKSPISNKKEQFKDDKLKKYAEAVEKFKDQLQTSNKMSEELRRLKQERKRRLQAKQKQKEAQMDYLIKSQVYSSPQGKQDVETFKKKDYYEYYTPKYQKSGYNQRFNKQKLALNINKTKPSSYADQIHSAKPKVHKFDNYMEEAHSAKLPPSKFNSSTPNQRKSSEVITGGKLSIRDFILGKNLGQGKFGVVYQAFHKATGWLYALKKVPKEMIKSHLMVDQFILELKLQTFLDHQNILSLYASFDDKTHVYLVLEYMEEGTLFTHFKKNKTLPEPQVAKKMRQMASAIKYLHENTIAHRDIKPQNIVMSHGVCKLCDFGWSTVCDDRRKTYCGTFDYAPPQILQGVQYDYTVDLWCLGVLTYQLLVGKAPFYHISRKQTMKKIINVEKTNIDYPENLSKNAVSFIDSLIKKDPKDRLSSDVILEHPFLKNAEEKN